MNEDELSQSGLYVYPKGRTFWYNTDYQLYDFVLRYPEYKILFTCEYDCYVNVDISVICNLMLSEGIDFVGECIRTDRDIWHWKEHLFPYYSNFSEVEGRLLCCAAFTYEFIRELYVARLEQSQKAKVILETGEAVVCWPNNEAFVGAEIARLQVSACEFSRFGDASAYDWAPAFPEFALKALSEAVIIHPVLDERRCVNSYQKLGWKAEDIFDKNSDLSSFMARFSLVDVRRMFLSYFAEVGSLDNFRRLRQAIESESQSDQNIYFNVALGKPATQSSISDWSRLPDRRRDAGGAVSGSATGQYGFHTNFEDSPWWCVDLEASFPVRRIRIYNRLDQPHRACGLVVQFSCDLIQWKILFRETSALPFGGADGHPLTISLDDPVIMRFIRLHLEKREWLHLDQVEIFV